MACNNKEFFILQAEVLKKCIEEDKWYLSEKAGKDIGCKKAQEHFFDIFFEGFAVGFRASYCGIICPNRFNCEIGRKYAI